jgi:hypothetical protein
MKFHKQTAASVLVTIFLLLLVGALAVDLITYWPTLFAGGR